MIEPISDDIYLNEENTISEMLTLLPIYFVLAGVDYFCLFQNTTMLILYCDRTYMTTTIRFIQINDCSELGHVEDELISRGMLYFQLLFRTLYTIMRELVFSRRFGEKCPTLTVGSFVYA